MLEVYMRCKEGVVALSQRSTGHSASFCGVSCPLCRVCWRAASEGRLLLRLACNRVARRCIVNKNSVNNHSGVTRVTVQGERVTGRTVYGIQMGG